jgi:hypothetical protein
MKEIFAAIVITIMVTFRACTGSPDTISQASPQISVAYPQAGNSYNVVGVVKGLEMFIVRYNNGIYRGGNIRSKEGMQWLKSEKISTIISITPTDLEERLAAQHNIELVKIPFSKGKPLSHKEIHHFLSVVKNNDSVYVHCYEGAHRAGALCIAARLYLNGWSYEKAEEEFIKLGGTLEENTLTMESIRKYK